jgi:hypothetical protein
MDMGEFRAWADMAQWAVSAAIGLYAWQATRHRATNARVDQHERKLSTIEERLAHLPTGADVGGLRVSLEELRGDVRTLGATLQGVRDEVTAIGKSVDRVNDYLLRHDR